LNNDVIAAVFLSNQNFSEEIALLILQATKLKLKSACPPILPSNFMLRANFTGLRIEFPQFRQFSSSIYDNVDLMLQKYRDFNDEYEKIF
jgi:hypothetical protein